MAELHQCNRCNRWFEKLAAVLVKRATGDPTPGEYCAGCLAKLRRSFRVVRAKADA